MSNTVGVVIDHIAVPAQSPEHSARFLADVLGIPVSRDGADDEFYCLRLDAGAQILFTQAQKFEPIHFALRVTEKVFGSVVEYLRKNGINFGNDPEDPTNEKTSDPLGGHGRVYFHSADGHLFEVCG